MTTVTTMATMTMSHEDDAVNHDDSDNKKT
jgi:hypothetical protein